MPIQYIAEQGFQPNCVSTFVPVTPFTKVGSPGLNNRPCLTPTVLGDSCPKNCYYADFPGVTVTTGPCSFSQTLPGSWDLYFGQLAPRTCLTDATHKCGFSRSVGGLGACLQIGTLSSSSSSSSSSSGGGEGWFNAEVTLAFQSDKFPQIMSLDGYGTADDSDSGISAKYVGGDDWTWAGGTMKLVPGSETMFTTTGCEVTWPDSFQMVAIPCDEPKCCCNCFRVDAPYSFTSEFPGCSIELPPGYYDLTVTRTECTSKLLNIGTSYGCRWQNDTAEHSDWGDVSLFDYGYYLGLHVQVLQAFGGLLEGEYICMYPDANCDSMEFTLVPPTSSSSSSSSSSSGVGFVGCTDISLPSTLTVTTLSCTPESSSSSSSSSSSEACGGRWCTFVAIANGVVGEPTIIWQLSTSNCLDGCGCTDSTPDISPEAVGEIWRTYCEPGS